MKSVILIFLSICLYFPSQTFSSEVNKVWGKIKKVPESKNIHGYQYFIFFTQNNKNYAYPLKPKNKEQEKFLEKNVGKLSKLSGDTIVEEIDNDGEKIQFISFLPSQFEPLKISHLGVPPPKFDLNSSDPREVNKPKEECLEGGIILQSGSRIHDMRGKIKNNQITVSKKSGMSDNVTNALIFAGGALTIAKMLGL